MVKEKSSLHLCREKNCHMVFILHIHLSSTFNFGQDIMCESPTHFKIPSKKFQVCLNIHVKLKYWMIMLISLPYALCREPEMAVILAGL